jgi:3-methyladenine DNA glycosylase/8-oxoguanine DNA glycosylase
MSFICSSNNNIARITSMLASVRKTFGKQLAVVRDTPFYSFPTSLVLSNLDESALRGIGLGYRAPFVVKSATLLVSKGGAGWLDALRSPSIDRASAQEQLLEFAGEGGVFRRLDQKLSLFLDKPSPWLATPSVFLSCFAIFF